MTAVWLRFGADLRRHLRAFIALGVLAGITGAVVMTAAAGARRTNSTVSRTVRASRAADVLANPDNDPGAAWAKVDRLPQVAAVATVQAYLVVPAGRDGRPDRSFENTLMMANTDGNMFHGVERWHLVAGRYFNPANPHEIVVNERLARERHWRVGTKVGIYILSQAEAQAPDPSKLVPHASFPTRVAGIVQSLDDATRAADDPRYTGAILFTPAFSREPGLLPLYSGKFVRLRHGVRDLTSFETAASGLSPENINYEETRSTITRANRDVRPYVFTLWLFAGLAMLIGGMVVAQTVARQHRADARDHDLLRALGIVRRDLVALGALRGLVIGLVGAFVALAGAWLASSLMPIGPLRPIEPSPGRSVDVLVFVAGALALVVLMTVHGALSAQPARSVRRRRAHRELPNMVPAPVSTGVRFALDRGQGSVSVPLRSTLLGVTIAVGALVASTAYGAALARFTSTPRLYGWVWDYQVEVHDNQDAVATAKALSATPNVKAFAPGAYTQLSFGRQSVAAIAVKPTPGIPTVETVSGHAPVTAGEIALGATTMRSLGVHVGEVVHGGAGGRSVPLRVVGEAVFPRFAPYSGSDATGLGTGAVITLDALKRVTPSGLGNGQVFDLVMLKPGVHTSVRAFRAGITKRAGTDLDVFGAQRPNDVLSYQHLQRTPIFFAALLVALGAATTAHLLVTGVRRRRKDLGLLKAIGCTIRQLLSIVLVQASTLVVLTLFVAIPLGVVAGRASWALTAHWLGIPSQPVVPIGVVTAVIVIALAAGNVVAFWPGLSAGRVRAAVALRTE